MLSMIARCLVDQVPNRGYFTEPTNSILVTRIPNLRQAREYFSNLNFKAVSGNRYLGSWMGVI